MHIRKRAKNVTLDRKIGMLVGASWKDAEDALTCMEYRLAQVSMDTMLRMRSEWNARGGEGVATRPVYIAWDGEDRLLLYPATLNGGELRITAYGVLMEL